MYYLLISPPCSDLAIFIFRRNFPTVGSLHTADRGDRSHVTHSIQRGWRGHMTARGKEGFQEGCGKRAKVLESNRYEMESLMREGDNNMNL